MRFRSLLLAACIAACGGNADKNHDGIADGTQSPNSVSLIAPSSPVGTISGQILTATLKGLDGVDVSAVIGGNADVDGMPYTTKTDGTGSFAIKGVPAGATAQVTISKSGYATARTAVVVPGAAGNFPINNGNANVGAIVLTDTSGTLKVQVVTAAGHPAKNAKGTLEVSPAASRLRDDVGYGDQVGITVVDAIADENGFLNFSGVPQLSEETRLNGSFTVTVGALDEDSDGTPEFLGTQSRYSAAELYFDSTPRVLTLPYSRSFGTLSLIASNVDSMILGATSTPVKNMVKPGDSIFFVFDQAVQDASIVVKVTDELGTTTINNSKVLSKSGNVLQVTPTLPLVAGKEYNVALRAVSLQNGTLFTGRGFFFGGDIASPIPFAIEKVTYRKGAGNIQGFIETGDTVVVIFNQPIKNIGGGAVEMQFQSNIGNTATIGDFRGEFGDPNGISIFPNEPFFETGATFPNVPSGYTTRYEIAPLITASPVNNGVAVKVLFHKLNNTLGGYQTIWGTTVDTDEMSATSIP
jgi:hypothetical protein